MKKLLPIAVVGFALSAAPAPAQLDCGDDPNNLLSSSNCDFDGGIAGWVITSGTGRWIRSDGEPQAGSLRIDSDDLLLDAGAESPCVAATPGASYGSGARLKLRSGNAGMGCTTTVTYHNNASCEGGVIAATSETSAINTTGWVLVSTLGSAPAGATHARFELFCASSREFTAGMDNVFIGEGLTVPVELQSFSIE